MKTTCITKTPLERLRHHVTGAIERGEAEPVVEIATPATHTPKPKKLTQSNFIRIENDGNGNPRYYLPVFMASEKAVRKIGGVKYRGKRYGAGWVFQSYALQGAVNALNSLS
jgi:hypothetical protein